MNHSKSGPFKNHTKIDDLKSNMSGYQIPNCMSHIWVWLGSEYLWWWWLFGAVWSGIADNLTVRVVALLGSVSRKLWLLIC